MREILLRAPATIANVGPGFDVFALALERPYDLFRIRLDDTGRVRVSVCGGDVPLPTDPERNTAGLAALHFLKATGAAFGVDIEIRKRMPSASGLGSSAASASAAAWGLNRLTGSRLSPVEVVEIAARGEAASGGTPHADNVAACCLGGFVLITGRTPLAIERLDVPAIPVVVRVRRKAHTTTRGLIPGLLPLETVKAQMAGCAALVHALDRGDVARFGRVLNVDHISEPVRSKEIPGYERLKARVLEAGAWGFNVSGGGASVFAVCPEDRTAAVEDLLRADAAAAGETAEVFSTGVSNGGLREHDGL